MKSTKLMQLYSDAQYLSMPEFLEKHETRGLLDEDYAQSLLDNLLNKVCSYFTTVSPEDVKGRTRLAEVVKIRHLYCYLAWEFYNQNSLSYISLKQIGRSLNRDHSTIIHSIKNYNDWLIREPYIKLIIDDIKEDVIY